MVMEAPATSGVVPVAPTPQARIPTTVQNTVAAIVAGLSSALRPSPNPINAPKRTLTTKKGAASSGMGVERTGVG